MCCPLAEQPRIVAKPLLQTTLREVLIPPAGLAPAALEPAAAAAGAATVSGVG